MSSGTEANNTLLRSFPDHLIFTSALEHSSVINAALDATRIPVDAHGVVQLDALDALLSQAQRPALVSVMLANNETGVIQPLTEISRIARAHHALLHTDAVQALGKIPVGAGLLGADYITLSAHKCGGPVGAAALVARGNIPLQPLLRGGTQEQGRRAGTENVASMAGFALAVELANDSALQQQRRAWHARMEQALLAQAPHAQIFSRHAPRLPNTTCITMPGVRNETQLMDFDLKGFCVSAGSACSSGRIEPSHVLLAMNAEKEQAETAIRISSGWGTQEEDILAFTEAWKALYLRLKNNASGDAANS